MNPYSSFRNSRRRPLVAALAAMFALGAVAGSASAGDVSTAGLRDGETYDRFIVKYRDGSTARASSATLQRSLVGAVSRAALGPSVRERTALPTACSAMCGAFSFDRSK